MFQMNNWRLSLECCVHGQKERNKGQAVLIHYKWQDKYNKEF